MTETKNTDPAGKTSAEEQKPLPQKKKKTTKKPTLASVEGKLKAILKDFSSGNIKMEKNTIRIRQFVADSLKEVEKQKKVTNKKKVVKPKRQLPGFVQRKKKV